MTDGALEPLTEFTTAEIEFTRRQAPLSEQAWQDCRTMLA